MSVDPDFLKGLLSKLDGAKSNAQVQYTVPEDLYNQALDNLQMAYAQGIYQNAAQQQYQTQWTQTYFTGKLWAPTRYLYNLRAHREDTRELIAITQANVATPGCWRMVVSKVREFFCECGEIPPPVVEIETLEENNGVPTSYMPYNTRHQCVLLASYKETRTAVYAAVGDEHQAFGIVVQEAARAAKEKRDDTVTSER